MSESGKRIKVCGLNNATNFAAIDALPVDFVGIIFYDKSPRYVGKGDLTPDHVMNAASKKVGVFVNQPLEHVVDLAEAYRLDYIQLHGQESRTYCWDVKSLGFGVIKAIPIAQALDIESLESYQHVIDLFLFDTSGKTHGGTGVKFDWKILDGYKLKVPFFLSGGLGPQDAGTLSSLQLKNLYGFDVNSKFELTPGTKDVAAVASFLKLLNQ